MAVVGTRKNVVDTSNAFSKNEMRNFTEAYLATQNCIMESAGVSRINFGDTLLSESANASLMQFFVEDSVDPEDVDLSPSDVEEKIEEMEALYTNDREGILESANMASLNPVIGLTFPMHKWILMNMVFDKGGIPKFVATSPSITITQESRFLVDTEGNEIDMFKQQNEMTAAIDKTAALQQFAVTLPLSESTEIVHNELGGIAGQDHLSIETKIYAVKVAGVWFDEGDQLPDADGFLSKNSPIATAADVGAQDLWVRVNAPFQPGYSQGPNQGYDRALNYRVKYTYKDSATTTATLEELISGTMNKDRLNVNTNGGNITDIMIESRLDTSNARATMCSVKWRQDTTLIEIPNAIPINTTISPEEVKDINALYNVNQVTKIMATMKTPLANYKDDKIREHLDTSYEVMDASSKTYSSFNWAPPVTFAGDPITWRKTMFLDHLDQDVTLMLQVLNDPNMTVTIYGDPDMVRRVTPAEYAYQTPAALGPVELDYTKTVYTSDKRHYQFIGSDKLRGTTEFIMVLCPRGTDRVLYRIYDYQTYLSNEIRNPDNPSLPALHAFERWKFVEYTPVQGRINVLNPRGINTANYDQLQVKSI